VTDFDLRLREQRLRPFLVTLASALLAWLVLWFGQAPRLLLVLTGAAWLQIALLLGITLRWKISAHCATAAAFIVLALALLGSAAAPLTFILPLVAWSRLRLQRHNLPQTIAGSFLGSVVLQAALYFGA
jgi:membrane-associated phospholipid phosphatase